jgi:hypothetical protein
VILPKNTIAGILSGAITAARIPLSTFPLTCWVEDGEERCLPILPKQSTPIHAAKDRTEGMAPSEPCQAGERRCKVRIASCERVSLDSTTDDDAQAEGYRDADDYALAFMSVYGKAWTGTDGYLIRFEIDRSRSELLVKMPWDPGTEDGQYKRAPEPEGVSQAEASKFSDRSIARRRREQQQQVAWYRSLSLADQLRLIQQDDALADRHRGDLKVIARRIEAMWNKGKAA